MPDKISALWTSVVTTYSPGQVEFFGTCLVQLVAFWIPSAVYISLDRLLPAFSVRHKLQPPQKQPTAAELRDCLAVALSNQLISLAIQAASIYLGSRPSGSGPAFRPASSPLPSAAELARDLVLCCLLREVLFYHAHRFLHRPAFYRAIHKQHHRFTAPVALAAQYAHPLEHVVANTLPVAIPPMLLRSHVVTMWAFLALMLFETATVHSGYDFFSGHARMHDAHHEKFNVNFGVFGLLDRFYGTDGRGNGPAGKVRDQKWGEEDRVKPGILL